ncbi:MAG: OmpA family protein [Gammaproteobacteria bacterium]|nr:OmpA family protein [Gammaproteobacteria bacterium]
MLTSIKASQCNRRRGYGWVAGLALGLAWSTLLAAPPSHPQTAVEIERALGGEVSNTPSDLQLRGVPSSSGPSVGRLRGPAGIVDDPTSTQQDPVRLAPVQAAESVETLDYPALIQNRPKVAALIHFDLNSASIRSDAYPLLNEYVSALKSTALADAVLIIAGHTDAIGSNEHNLLLSEKRARAVRDYLLERGIAPARLMAKGYGETYPVSSNATEAGRELNRRSEFIRVDVQAK